MLTAHARCPRLAVERSAFARAACRIQRPRVSCGLRGARRRNPPARRRREGVATGRDGPHRRHRGGSGGWKDGVAERIRRLPAALEQRLGEPDHPRAFAPGRPGRPSRGHSSANRPAVPRVRGIRRMAPQAEPHGCGSIVGRQRAVCSVHQTELRRVPPVRQSAALSPRRLGRLRRVPFRPPRKHHRAARGRGAEPRQHGQGQDALGCVAWRHRGTHAGPARVLRAGEHHRSSSSARVVAARNRPRPIDRIVVRRRCQTSGLRHLGRRARRVYVPRRNDWRVPTRTMDRHGRGRHPLGKRKLPSPSGKRLPRAGADRAGRRHRRSSAD